MSGEFSADAVALAARVLAWLRSNLRDDGVIWDPAEDRRSPPDHYAESFAGLGFALMARHAPEEGWDTAARACTEYALTRPEGGGAHREFDALAFSLLRRCSPDLAVEYPGEWAQASARRRAEVSRNWLAMMAAIRALEGAAPEEALAGLNVVLEAQLNDGFFVDSRQGMATPLVYHAKICAMLAVVAAVSGDESSRLAGVRGLDALLPFISPAGRAFYHGRSTETPFGYAAAILAYRLAGVVADDPRAEAYHEAADRLLSCLARRQADDGHLRITPREVGRLAWDVYVHTPVYNAYAAALLLIAAEPDLLNPVSRPEPATRPLEIRRNAPVAGLWCVDEDGVFAAFATTGQAVPYDPPFYGDLRTWGMQPLCLEVDGELLIPPPPLWWRGERDRSTLVDPAGSTFTPWLELQGRRYCVRRYDSVNERSKEETRQCIATGTPTQWVAPLTTVRLARKVLPESWSDQRPFWREEALTGVALLRAWLWSATLRAWIGVSGCGGQLPFGLRACWANPMLLGSPAADDAGVLSVTQGRAEVRYQAFIDGEAVSDWEQDEVPTVYGWAKRFCSPLRPVSGDGVHCVELLQLDPTQQIRCLVEDSWRVRIEGEGVTHLLDFEEFAPTR